MFARWLLVDCWPVNNCLWCFSSSTGKGKFVKLCSLPFEGSVPLPARSVSRDLLSQSVKSHADEKFHCGEQTHSRPATRQRNMQHKSRDMSPPYSPSSLYFQRSPGSQPKQILYRVSQFPAVPLSCYFWIQSQTALFLAGKPNKHNSVRTDVNEILIFNADGSVFPKYKQI